MARIRPNLSGLGRLWARIGHIVSMLPDVGPTLFGSVQQISAVALLEGQILVACLNNNGCAWGQAALVSTMPLKQRWTGCHFSWNASGTVRPSTGRRSRPVWPRHQEDVASALCPLDEQRAWEHRKRTGAAATYRKERADSTADILSASWMITADAGGGLMSLVGGPCTGEIEPLVR